MSTHERFTLRNVYLYLVCLITLVVSLFAAVQLVRGVVGVVYPDPWSLGYYGYEEPGGEVSDADRERMEERARDSERRNEILGLVGSATTLLIAGPLYVYHWRRVQSELARPAADPTAA